jgi:hypothetical protein
MKWQNINSAPRDGTHFIGKNIFNGYELETWYEEKKPTLPFKIKPDLDIAKVLLAESSGKWWAFYRGKEIISFDFHVWR